MSYADPTTKLDHCRQPCGHESRYAAGCRCAACRNAHRIGAKRRKMAIARGTRVPRSVPALGARRRVQALACLGWSLRVQSRMIGMGRDSLQVKIRQERVSPATAAKVRILYERLSMTLAPQTTRSERISARQVIRLAGRAGWVPPLAWDDDDLDDPRARPHRPNDRTVRRGVDEVAVQRIITGGRVRSNIDQAEAARRLRAAGWSITQVADRVGYTPRSVARLTRRAS